MLDGNACAARCWEGRARQRLNIAVKMHTRRIHVSLLFLTVFLNKPCLAKARRGARLIYIIDTFVAARHRRENKCLRGASWRVFHRNTRTKIFRKFRSGAGPEAENLFKVGRARVNEPGWPCASRRRTGQAADRSQRRRPVELLFAPADGR